MRIIAGTMGWRLESDNAFLVKRVCTQPPRPSRPTSTSPGRCTGRGIQDVRFLNATVGELSHFGHIETSPYEDRFGGDGRIRDCGQATVLYTLANPGQEIEGFIRTAAGSQGVAYGWSMPETIGDAIGREPADAIHCTTEAPDGMGGWMNPRPYTVPPTTRPRYTSTTPAGSTPPTRGERALGDARSAVPTSPIREELHRDLERALRGRGRSELAAPVLDDELRLTLEPCPDHGVDVQSC